MENSSSEWSDLREAGHARRACLPARTRDVLDRLVRFRQVGRNATKRHERGGYYKQFYFDLPRTNINDVSGLAMFAQTDRKLARIIPGYLSRTTGARGSGKHESNWKMPRGIESRNAVLSSVRAWGLYQRGRPISGTIM